MSLHTQLVDNGVRSDLSALRRDYIVIWIEGGTTFAHVIENMTKNERLEYVTSGLRINVEHGRWAFGYFDERRRSWHVSGSDAGLMSQISDLPAPLYGRKLTELLPR